MLLIFVRGPLLMLGIALLFFAVAGQASEDVPNSKDHPLLSRYPDSHITAYERTYNAVQVLVAAQGRQAQRKTIEGDTTVIRYFYSSPDKQPSPLQLIRNYQAAIRSIGGQVMYERLQRDSDSGETTLKVVTGGKEVWVRVEPDMFGAPTQSYRLTIVEVAAMQQVVSASQLLDELNKNGYVALYINFDTGRAELKDDGRATVAEIVSMLKAAPAIRLSVEGHTDNVGAAAANKGLSERRARSVMTAIVSGGIEAKRLSAAGFGQERPVADNRSDEGRAKNRRVELVKQ